MNAIQRYPSGEQDNKLSMLTAISQAIFNKLLMANYNWQVILQQVTHGKWFSIIKSTIGMRLYGVVPVDASWGMDMHWLHLLTLILF